MNILSNFDIPFFEMRCPSCGATQQVRVHSSKKFLTDCHQCKSDLIVRLMIQEKPNNILFSLNVVAVPCEAESSDKKLQVAAA